MYKSCSFSGHRYGLGELDVNLLDKVIKNLIIAGTGTFYCGMAVGFDLAAAESVLSLKKIYPVRLIACIPCEGQNDSFSGHDRARYGRILNNCDEQIFLAPRYYNGCMQERDKFMVDNSDVLVCFLRKNGGGTYYTVNYAKKKGLKIIEV